MIYITGDTHRDFYRVKKLCNVHSTTIDDVLIILGDAGINYFGDYRDADVKRSLSELPITLFCIHGNHEMRPSASLGYSTIYFNGGKVYYQPEFPNVLFAKDGEVYDFAGNRCMVCGGAYSVDKYFRLQNGYAWFPDEQPDEATRTLVMDRLADMNYSIDVFLSHTCPYRYVPREAFLTGIDQKTVDVNTEYWLEKVEEVLQYQRWYCGHYHTNKSVDKIRFLFEDIIELPPKTKLSTANNQI